MRRISYLFLAQLAGIFVSLLALCYVSGRFTPHLVPDTPSYVDYSFATSDDMATAIRTPGYPAILQIFGRVLATPEGVLQAVVIWQILIHAIAVAVWFDELVQWAVPRRAAIIGCVALAVTNTFWDHINTIATDAISMSLGLLVAAMVVRVWRLGNSLNRAVVIGLLVLTAIAIRPAYLFLLPWVGLAMLIRPAGSAHLAWSKRMFDVVVMLTIPVVGLVGWCGFRGSVTGDYGILPFGHQNMAAVTTQLLDNDELASLPGTSGELGAAIARSRSDLLGMETRADAYMALEGNWDEMTYSVVIPTAIDVIGGSVVEQHQALAKLDAAIVQAYPLRYGKWILLAIRRAVWGSFANLAMHPIYFTCGMAMAVWAILWSVRRTEPHTGSDWSPIKPLVLATVSYAFCKIGFVSLTSPPIGRFSDAAMALVPLLVAVTLVAAATRESEQIRIGADRA